ncbi:hypothetical protein GLYMA_13G188400v4, partial [Glycine max]
SKNLEDLGFRIATSRSFISLSRLKIFKNTFQSGFLSILYSLGSKPLQIWDKEVVNAHVKRPQDEDIQSNVLEIIGSNIQSTYITCPADPAATLGIKLPFLVLIVKNLKKYFTFEIQVLDDKNVRRRFQASNFQVCCHSGKALHCTMPLRMMRGGIKSSLTWLISPREHMVLIMWRHCKFRSMQTVA